MIKKNITKGINTRGKVPTIYISLKPRLGFYSNDLILLKFKVLKMAINLKNSLYY